MDRIALSKRIKGLSEVFASDNEIAQDLKAMSYVLENMNEEKFASIINPDVGADGKDAALGDMTFGTGVPKAGPAKMQEIRERMREPGTPGTVRTLQEFAQLAAKVLGEENINKPGFLEKVFTKLKQMKGEPTPSMEPAETKIAEEEDMSETEGMYWNKAASDAVADALLKDVVGMDKSICCDTKRKLEKVEMPDSEKKQETPPTLKGEQIPQDKENHDSGIVEKANAAKKQASDEEAEAEEAEAVEDIKEGIEKIEEAVEKLEEAEEKEEGKEEDKDEGKEEDKEEDKVEEKEEEKEEEKVEATEEEEEKKEASVVDDSMLNSEGVELIAPMSEIKLSSDDESELSKLFD